MPRDGAFMLSDVRAPTLSIVCKPCSRRETYSVARLVERHGDAQLTDLLQTLANARRRARPASTTSARRYSKGLHEPARLALRRHVQVPFM